MMEKNRSAFLIPAVYLVSGAGWVYFTDKWLPLFVDTREKMLLWGTCKGWGYVFLTTIILYMLIRTFSKKLETENKKYHAIFEGANDAILLADEKGYFECNAAAERLFGLSKEEILRRKPGQLASVMNTDGSVSEHTIEGLSGKVLDGSPQRHESKIVCEDGRVLDIDVNLAPITLDGKRTALLMVRDVTGMKKAAEQTAHSEMKFRAIFENANDAIFLIDENGIYVDCNPAAVDLFGCDKSELLNRTPNFFSPRVQPDGRSTGDKARELISLAIQGMPQRFEWRHSRLNGTEFDAAVVLGRFELHGQIILQAIVRDISDWKKAEEIIRRSEEQLLLFFEHQLVGMSITSADKSWLRVNNKLCSMLGYSRRELENLTWVDITHPDDLGANQERYISLLKGEIDGYVLDKRFLCKDGTVMHATISTGCVRRDDGYPDYVMTLYEDITERKLAEEQIIAQAAQIRALIDNLPFDLWAVGADGSCFMQNSVSRQIWGNIIGKTPDQAAMSNTIAKKWRENNERAFSGEVVKGEIAYTINGENRFFYNIIAPIISNQHILGILGVNIDISERKNLELQLHQAQKMEAVGQLAGGVAHDFNNILTAIIGYAHLLLMKMSDDDPSKGYVGQIRASAERAAELTNALLTFSRKQVMVPISADLNDIVGKLEKMLRRLIRESIVLRLELALEKLTVLADQGKIEQVIVNLVTNAADAMPKAGTIAIGTCQVSMRGSFIHSHGYGKPGNYACITVSDTGCGLDDETRKRIFEPFFTTKETGKGTGLGLSIVYGIVKQHNGYINVYSEPGRGTTFRIYIPLSEAGEESSPTEKNKTVPAGGTETLLLAEDDPIVSEFHRTLLETAGYTVITAVDGEDALDKFLEYEEGIDLLVFDVIMPRMTGKKVYGMIRKTTPEIKVLYLSGYPADVLSDVGVVQDRESFMPKPVDPDDLLRKVRELLDKPRKLELVRK